MSLVGRGRRLGGLHNWSRCFWEEKNLLPPTRPEFTFLGGPSHSLVTASTQLSEYQHSLSAPSSCLGSTQPQPTHPGYHTRFYKSVLLTMGIMMPETCWELTNCEQTSILVSSVGSFFSYGNDVRSHEPKACPILIDFTNPITKSQLPDYAVLWSIYIYVRISTETSKYKNGRLHCLEKRLVRPTVRSMFLLVPCFVILQSGV